MGGSKGFTNKAKSGAVAQQARIDRAAARQKADGRVVRRARRPRTPRPPAAATVPEAGKR